jgi:hypothetical protein
MLSNVSLISALQQPQPRGEILAHLDEPDAVPGDRHLHPTAHATMSMTNLFPRISSIRQPFSRLFVMRRDSRLTSRLCLMMRHCFMIMNRQLPSFMKNLSNYLRLNTPLVEELALLVTLASVCSARTFSKNV